MRKKVRGFIKNAGTRGESAFVGRNSGYHDTWDTGAAHFIKNQQKLSGANRPST